MVVITIDGPSGAGKSEAAARFAKIIGLPLLNSGFMYRAIALMTVERYLDPNDDLVCSALFRTVNLAFLGPDRISVDGRDVTPLLHTEEVTRRSALVGALPNMHALMRDWQRASVSGSGCVAEGRDQGTYVFPDAKVKFWLDADEDVRIARVAQSRGKEVANQTRERDERDRKRKVGPLKNPEGSYEIDSTYLSLDEVVGRMVEIVKDVILI